MSGAVGPCCPVAMDLAALGSQDFGEHRVGGGERGVGGEGGCRGDAVGKADGRALAVVTLPGGLWLDIRCPAPRIPATTAAAASASTAGTG